MKFKKILAVTGSVMLLGMTMGLAGASFPNPFVKEKVADMGIVYGTNAATSDFSASTGIGNYIKSMYDAENAVTTTTLTTSGGITENELVLGDSIISGKLKDVLTDNKIPSLFDGKITWDDGESSDTEFNTHEEILINNMLIKTTLQDNELKSVALTNDQGLEYRYVFEEDLNIDFIGHEDADALVINFLGEEVEISEVNDDEVTFTYGNNHLLNQGESVTFNGKNIVLESVFDDKVYISVEGVTESIREGETARFNGVEVRVREILFQGYSGGKMMSEIVVSDDIDYTVEDGEAYIGEDEDDPVWVWSISNPGSNGGYIGVRYNEREQDSDDNLVYEGESYVFPKNFAQVVFNGLTDVDYTDFDLTFDDSKDLYNTTNNVVKRDNAQVAILSGESDEAFLIDSKETDSIYLYYNDAGNGSIEVYYKDVNEDISDSARVRYTNSYPVIESFEDDLANPTAWGTMLNASNDTVLNMSNPTAWEQISTGSILDQTIATLTLDDTDLDVSISVTNGDVVLSIGEIDMKVAKDGSFSYLGSTEEDAEADDVSINGNNIGTEENDVITSYGIKIHNPENNAENDEVILSIPDEQVYAEVSVLGSEGTINTNTTILNELLLDSILVKDNEVNSVSDKNLIVVGGSCINSVASELLGVPLGTCGTNFTVATGVSAGQYLLQTFASPYNSEKVVILVAGYNAEDTTRGYNDLIARHNFSVIPGIKEIN